MNKDSKIYVSGHTGLIGSAIWKVLETKGYTNLIGASHDELDLKDSVAVKNFFDTHKPENVVLAASRSGKVSDSDTDRADYIYHNLQIQNNVIGESFRHDVKKLLFFGSTCIYPKEATQPINEDSLLTSTLEYNNEPYAIAKIAGLKMCESFNIQYDTNYVSVMPTNLYGPNDNFNLEKCHILTCLIRKMHLSKCLYENNWSAIKKDISRRPLGETSCKTSFDSFISTLSKYGIYSNQLVFWGNEKLLREYLWSEDLADASVFILENIDFNDLIKDKEEIRNCHINIGTGIETSIKDLIKIVANTVGYTGKVKFNNYSSEEPMRKLTDVSRLNSMGWTHTVDIQEGVNKLYEWYLKDQETTEQ